MKNLIKIACLLIGGFMIGKNLTTPNIFELVFGILLTTAGFMP